VIIDAITEATRRCPLLAPRSRPLSVGGFSAASRRFRWHVVRRAPPRPIIARSGLEIAPIFRGTGSSNPSPSSGVSPANLSFRRIKTSRELYVGLSDQIDAGLAAERAALEDHYRVGGLDRLGPVPSVTLCANNRHWAEITGNVPLASGPGMGVRGNKAGRPARITPRVLSRVSSSRRQPRMLVWPQREGVSRSFLTRPSASAISRRIVRVKFRCATYCLR
jgi:hypothetical protein